MPNIVSIHNTYFSHHQLIQNYNIHLGQVILFIIERFLSSEVIYKCVSTIGK